jgi:hypothetical protein
MPEFTFTGPDGQTYKVNGPDGATKEQAFQILKQQMLKPAYKDDGGKVITGLPGDHHDDIDKGIPEDKRGFVDLKGNFLSRSEAAKVAKSMGMDVPDEMHTSDLNRNTGLGGEEKQSSKFPGYMKDQAAAPSRMERFGTGLKDIAVGIQQMGAHLAPAGTDDPFVDQEALAKAQKEEAQKVDQRVSERERGIQAERAAAGQTGVDLYRLGGNIAGTIPLATLSPLASGAASGFLTPVNDGNFWGEKGKQVALGAVAGKAGEIGGNTIAKMLGPSLDAGKTALLNAGVTPTIGQLMGNVGRRVEEAAKSIPITGSVIRKGEERAMDSFNVATVNKALEPIGANITGKTGRDAIQEGQKALSAAYDRTLDKIKQVGTDKEFAADIANIRTMTDELPPGLSAQFDAILKNRVAQRFGPNGTMDGQTMKQTESELTNLAANLKSSSDAAQRQLGDAVTEVRGALRDAVARQNPEAAAELKNINKAYSQFADVELAASRRALSGSRFTPGDLLQAIKRSDRSPRDRRFAAGEGGPLQKWAEDAHQLIGSKMPDSGTAERLAHMNIPALLTGLATLPAAVAHTDAGMNFLRKASLFAPQTRGYLANMMTNLGQKSAPAVAAGANDLVGP